MQRRIAQRNALFRKVATPHKLVRQLGPSCEVHAYFHYIFTDRKRLYRYLTMDGWNLMLDQMLKHRDQLCINMADKLHEFFHDVEWKKELIYFIDGSAKKVYEMYPMLGDKNGVINMYYFNGKEGEELYLEMFKRLRLSAVFQDNSILGIRNKYEQMGAAALNETKDRTGIFDDGDIFRVEQEMGKDFEDAVQGHATTYTRGHIIDSNGTVMKLPTDHVDSVDTVISCTRYYCEPLIEIEETPTEIKFMDDIYDNMVNALNNEEFTPGLVERIVTGEMDRVKSRVTEDMKPIPMQSLE